MNETSRWVIETEPWMDTIIEIVVAYLLDSQGEGDNAMTPSQIIDKFNIWWYDETDLVNTLADHGLTTCPYCGHWCKESDLVNDEGEEIGCPGCR